MKRLTTGVAKLLWLMIAASCSGTDVPGAQGGASGAPSEQAGRSGAGGSVGGVGALGATGGSAGTSTAKDAGSDHAPAAGSAGAGLGGRSGGAGGHGGAGGGTGARGGGAGGDTVVVIPDAGPAQPGVRVCTHWQGGAVAEQPLPKCPLVGKSTPCSAGLVDLKDCHTYTCGDYCACWFNMGHCSNYAGDPAHHTFDTRFVYASVGECLAACAQFGGALQFKGYRADNDDFHCSDAAPEGLCQ